MHVNVIDIEYCDADFYTNKNIVNCLFILYWKPAFGAEVISEDETKKGVSECAFPQSRSDARYPVFLQKFNITNSDTLGSLS